MGKKSPILSNSGERERVENAFLGAVGAQRPAKKNISLSRALESGGGKNSSQGGIISRHKMRGGGQLCTLSLSLSLLSAA